MKFLKKIASASEAVQTDVNVLYATDTGVKLVKPLPTYTVTFKDYDDSVISTKVYKQDETVTPPSNPTREGFEFTGWSPTVSPTAVADAVYTAQYKEAKPTVETVDLGLSVNWMTCNIGATKPEEYGKYFMWADVEGELVEGTTTTRTYDWITTPFQTVDTNSYMSAKFTKYLGSTTSSYKDPSATDTDALKTVLDPSDDAASVATNGAARMPTEAEVEELTANTTSAYTTVNGVKGIKLTSTKEGYTDKYIFIPASGCAYDGSVSGRGFSGHVWYSNLNADNPYYAWYLYFDSSSVGVGSHARYNGFSVRGVVSKN